MKKYKLFYNSYELGHVAEETNEWPRSSGSIKLNDELEFLNEETILIFDFIEHSGIASELLENSQMEEYEEMCKQETKYLNLIDSPDWYLADESGKRTEILCPIFFMDGGIVWQPTKKSG